LYQLHETYYEQVKALWEDRFEKKYGFWRGFVDTVVPATSIAAWRKQASPGSSAIPVA
jgi:hypothetical protein